MLCFICNEASALLKAVKLFSNELQTHYNNPKVFIFLIEGKTTENGVDNKPQLWLALFFQLFIKYQQTDQRANTQQQKTVRFPGNTASMKDTVHYLKADNSNKKADRVING